MSLLTETRDDTLPPDEISDELAAWAQTPAYTPWDNYTVKGPLAGLGERVMGVIECGARVFRHRRRV